MSNKIKFVIPILALILIFSFALACNGGSETSSTTKNPKEETAEENPIEVSEERLEEDREENIDEVREKLKGTQEEIEEEESKDNNKELINNLNENEDNKNLLKNIEISAEAQDIFEGKQKIVVYVKNNNKSSSFTGKIRIEVVSVDDRPLGLEYIYIENLPPGGNEWTIIWAKPGGSSFYIGITNEEFKEMATVCEIPYEEVGSQGKTVYIYTTAKELNELQQIVDIYRNERYAGISVFQILFFNNKLNAIHAAENSIMSDADMLALFARYFYSKDGGYDNLSYEDWSSMD